MKENTTEIFAKRLIALVGERGMGRGELARVLGTTEATVSRYYTAARKPTTAMLTRAADFFGVTADYLLGLERESGRTAFAVRPPFAERFAALLQRYSTTAYRLSKDTQINEDTIRGWQRGESEPRADTLVRLAKYFGCSVDFILGRA